MISSVSRVSFGDNTLGAHQALIESPGKFAMKNTQQPAQSAMVTNDSTDAPKKHKTLKTIGGILGAVVVVGAALFGLSKCVKVNPDTTNVFRKGINKLVEAGEWIGKKVGGIFSKKGAEEAAETVADGATDAGGSGAAGIFA